MSMSKEDAFRRAETALKKAQDKYDKAYAAWQEELDGIVLKPMHVRNLSRKQAIQLARAISDDTIFKKIMEMGMIPVMSKANKNNDKENRNEIVKEN